MTAVLQQVSDALVTTVATVSPSIVRVEARRRLPASGLVWSRDGIIVTTHHVIEQDDNIRVGLHSGQTIASPAVVAKFSAPGSLLSCPKEISPLELTASWFAPV